MISENYVEIIQSANVETGYEKPVFLKKKLRYILRELEGFEFRSPDCKSAETWLRENLPFIRSTAKNITFKKRSVRKGIYPLLSDLFMKGLEPESGVTEVLELVGKTREFTEEELLAMPLLFRFSLIFSLYKSAKSSPEKIPCLITKYHHLDRVPYEQIRLHLSPLERVLRRDPDCVYPRMTRETQNEYRRRLVLYSKQRGEKPETFGKELLDKSEKEKKHFGFYLYRTPFAFWYFPLVIILFSVILLSLFLLASNVFVLCFSAIPLYFIAKSIVDFFATRFCKTSPLPAMRIEKVEENFKTLVVITTLISKEEDVEFALQKLNQYRLNNKGEGDEIYFGLLCDLPQSDRSFTEKDQFLYENLKEKIKQLNTGEDHYFSVLRKRVYHKSEDAFAGYERKRGAIEQFVKYLVTGEKTQEMLLAHCEKIKNAKYLISLDQDTQLGIGQAKRLIGMMEHPVNRPEIGYLNGMKRVLSGHGIIQPKVSCSLLSNITTPYAKIYSNGSGEVPYATASYDTMQTLFGQGNFCGKGILDVRAFYEVVCGMLPEQKILSHDMPEGALMRSAVATSEVFVDSDPQSAQSHYKRLHRWIRGDVQNLCILPQIPSLRRLFAVENLLRYLVPISELLLVVLSFFLPDFTHAIFSVIFIYHFLPFVQCILSVLLSGNIHIFSRRFKKRIVNQILNSFYQSSLSLFAVLHEAIYFFDAIIRSLYRLTISKKKLLEWQVYTPYSQGKNELFFYLPSIVFSSALFFFVQNRMQFFLCVIFLFYPFVMAILGRKYVVWNKISKNEREYLKQVAKLEFSFFENCVSEKSAYLVPDNIQFAPVEKIANRTSPTNIGLYLVSLVSAKEMDIISESEMVKRLYRAFLTIEKLEHFEGHLFNWYDLSTLGVIGERFISTVDNGNFLASLIVVRNALKKLSNPDQTSAVLIEKISREIEKCNFNLIFDRQRGLFLVGVFPDEPEKNSSYYDLYMSEARIVSYVGIALGKIPPGHWKNLSRPLLSFGSRVGVGSWTGTCFEYYMPALFFPTIENSMEDESLEFALYCQKKYGANGKFGSVFGISESGYNRVDDKGNLQYYAFGTPYLACYERGVYKKVISPYSSFLMLQSLDYSLVENLKRLEKMGAVGPFGYYEALDFGSNFIDDYSVVKSYMSHHKGMSVIALCNFLCDGAIQKLFLDSPEFSAKTELLAERFPLEEKIMKKKAPYFADNSSSGFHLGNAIYLPERKTKTFFTDGNLTMLIDRSGNNRVMIDGLDLFLPDKGGISCEILDQNNNSLLSFSEKNLIKSNFGQNYAEFILVKEKASAIFRYEILSGEKAFLLRMEINGISQPYKAVVAFDFIYQNQKEYLAHPAFQNLALEGEAKDVELKLVRRLVSDKRILTVKSSQTFRVKFYGFSPETSFPTRMLYDPKVVLIFDGAENCSTTIPLLFSAGKGETSLSNYLDGSFHVKQKNASLGEERMRRLDRICQMDRHSHRAQEHLLDLENEGQKYLMEEGKKTCRRQDLWSLGISGDYPLLTFVLSEKRSSLRSLSAYLKAYKKLQIAGLSQFDFVILHPSGDGYFNAFRGELNHLLTDLQCDFLLGKHPGIHVVPKCDEETLLLFSNLSSKFFGGDICSKTLPEEDIDIFCKEWKNAEENDVDVGKFDLCGFDIDKSIFMPKPPFSHVISGKYVGFVCNQNSLGFTWYRNAGLNRISKWDNIPNQTSGEKIFLMYNKKAIDLILLAKKVKYREGKVVYQGEFSGCEFEIVSTVSETISGKVVRVTFSNLPFENAKLVFSFVPVLGQKEGRNILLSGSNHLWKLSPAVYDEYECGAYLYSKENISVFKNEDRVNFSVLAGSDNLFVLGGFSSDSHLSFINQYCEEHEYDSFFDNHDKVVLGALTDKENPMEFWSLYQAVTSRFYARTGQYQSSGAYGFRDQLQDCLVFLGHAPEITKRHILRCAAHQFTEGDVLHWWHTIRKPGRYDPGVRTRCSDDYLWLLFATSEYIAVSGDDKILDISVPFLKGEKLKENENERYITSEIGEKGTLREHLEKAAKLLLSKGLCEHNLPDIGSGDWNDGMNQINGESVWLGFFGAICLYRTKGYFSEELEKEIELYFIKLKTGLENAFNGAYFVRCFDRNGRILGNDISMQSECSIDLITQAFAAFYQDCFYGTKFALEENMVKSALESAYEVLVNEKTRTVRLFTRPFAETVPSPGYIQRYHQGVRENGGQYTHAAVWFAMALFQYGSRIENDDLRQKGEELSKLLDPSANITSENFKRYQREPYVLCGDVYDAYGFRGHGGWSWYTGAAGWYYKLIKLIKEKKKLS